ncbi:Zn-ribbon domain-containing OB-fold protein [Pseudohoeflea coraliihabitans]|uniref:OB-fold domain-containing protein n=1 Tax=Pseudohoeflea coraliihabitans TaxID=2860393 RepID=A0ABS6WLZ1_9HYPH|nr:OB-fold domain-containing protein [Pseudohoeflea sp. DP4N28-3]MBW3096432.1 OB-fold domain-containing protein [Pseudohoeflea sp. DP4N28-3]
MSKEAAMTLHAEPDDVARSDALAGCECGHCGRRYFPKRTVCTECGSDGAMADVAIEGPGALYSHAIVQIAPKIFEVPYAVGYVDLPGDVRVLGQIVDWDRQPLKQGMKMQIDHAPIATEPDGSKRVSFVFRPAAD